MLQLSNHFSPSEKPSKKKSFFSGFREFIKLFAVALLLAIGIQHFLIINAAIPTGSMENTIHINDRVVASRLSYWFEDPKRGDIIIFPCPDNGQLYIKRIIGMPGEKLEIINGKVYINDCEKPLKEPYLKEIPSGNFGPYQIPDDHYFMMGDNRANSEDARFWENTYLDRDKILGKAIFRYYPNFSFLE